MYYDEIAYIIWYHKMFGSTKRGKKLLEYYGGDYFELYTAVINGCDKSGITDKMPMKKFQDYSPLDASEEVYFCKDCYWDIISCKSPYYPKELLETDSYPHILFCDGNLDVLTRRVKFAVVGSREAHEDAQIMTRNAAYNLTKTGAVIVSGGAFGIDSCAHLGAVEADGETICVLGGGFASSAMKRLGDFYAKVRKKGVFISEYFPETEPTRYTFPERNRLISGMSKAVLVACAAENSGSLITADCAKKQNRRVYAFSPDICYSTGCKKLIDEGAYVFYNAGDIAYPFRDLYDEGVFDDTFCNTPVNNISAVSGEDMAIPKKKTKKSASKTENKTEKKAEHQEKKKLSPDELPDYLSEEAVKIYSLLENGPVIIDHLVAQTGFRINEVLIAVSELEMEALVKCLPGNRIEII